MQDRVVGREGITAWVAPQQLPTKYPCMRGMGDFQRQQMKRRDPRDPRLLELFSQLRRVVDLLEDIAIRPQQPPEPTPSPPPIAPIQQAPIAPSPIPMLVTIKEARKLIGVSNSTIYRLIKEGALETIPLGSRRMVRYSSLQKLAGIAG